MSAAAYLNWLIKGGQLYRAVPFSKGFQLLHVAYLATAVIYDRKMFTKSSTAVK